MPTNTPLPAAEFRRLTDDICRVAENHENMDAVQWALRMLEVTGAYRAARASSPRTLEEALFIELAKLNDPHSSGVPMSSEYVESRADDIIAAIREHARRLAGEGGAA